jgi:hypothetical protein
MKAVAAVAALALSFSPVARADEPTPVSVSAGEALNVCQAGLVHCPVSSFLCDDPKVAIVENGPDGAVLKGISPGTTLCSLLGFERAFRRVIRVTVSKGDPARGP